MPGAKNKIAFLNAVVHYKYGYLLFQLIIFNNSTAKCLLLPERKVKSYAEVFNIKAFRYNFPDSFTWLKPGAFAIALVMLRHGNPVILLTVQ